MAVQIRSKRKKNFKPNEGMQLEEPVTPGVKQADASNLNVRRSGRKPKPKKRSDDFEENFPDEIKIKQEPPDDDEEIMNTPTVFMSETPIFDTGDDALGFHAGDVRRETRKSFQTYLETLGYNTDFSKIPSQEQHETWQRARKTSEKKSKMTIKTEPHVNFTGSWSPAARETALPEEPNAFSNVQASFRTPRQNKTVDLLQEVPQFSRSLDSINSTNVDAQKKSSKKIKQRKSGSQKVKTSEHHPPITTAQPSSTPLGKNEVDESDIMSDETDGTPTRTSGRIRVPKRQFSLLEVEVDHNAKRQRVVSPEQITSLDDKKGKQKESIPLNESTGSLAVKRSSVKKGKKKKEESGNTVDPCPGKVKKIIEDINIKRDTTESSQSETEKKLVVKKGRERIENLVEKLKLAKQSDSMTEEKSEETTSGQKKGVKRKRESNKEIKKRDGEGKKAEKQNEHIVLKLSLPHGKEKTSEKPHHKRHGKEKTSEKHHHKHKKTKEGKTVVKKVKKKATAAVKNAKTVKSSVSKKTAKKKMKLNIKQEKRDGNEAHPHVKLIIKKSPTKTAKIAEVMMQEVSEETLEVQEESTHESKETKAVVKKKVPTKKFKSLSLKPVAPRNFKKKKDKTMKSRTVSAYSLFTKNRRKGLLEKEPDLDFASTSRRLAEMWKNLPDADQEVWYWKAKARAVRMPNGRDPTRSFLRSRRGVYDSYNWSHFSDVNPSSSTGTEAIDMAAHLKLLGESLCSIGMCLKRQDQMEVHGSLSVLLDTALCSIVPIFCLTSQLPVMDGCSHETQAQILDNLAYIIPGL